jgi:MFS family permease
MSAVAAGRPRQAGLLQALALLLPITMSVMGSVVLQPVQPQMLAHYQNVAFHQYLVPFLLTVPAIVAMASSFFSGYLSDILGRRKLLLASMAVYVVVGVGPFFMDGWILVAICRILVGACEGVVLTVTTAMLGDYFKGEQRDRMMGFQAAIASGSATVLIWISGLLGAAYGWQGPFLIYAISILWGVGVWLFTWEPVPDERAGEHEGTASWAGFPWHIMAPICLVTIFGSYCFYTTQFETPGALFKFGITNPATIGLLCGPIISSGMLVGALCFQAVVRRALSVLLPAEFLLIGASFVCMGLASGAPVLVAAGFANQVGCGMLLPTLLTASMRFLPFEHRGRGTGLWQGTFASGQFVIGMSFPALTALVGGQISYAFLTVGVCALMAALIALVVAVRPQRLAVSAPGK